MGKGGSLCVQPGALISDLHDVIGRWQIGPWPLAKWSCILEESITQAENTARKVNVRCLITIAVSAGVAELLWDAQVRVWVEAAASPGEGDAKQGRQRQKKNKKSTIASYLQHNWSPPGKSSCLQGAEQSKCSCLRWGKRTLCPL